MVTFNPERPDFSPYGFTCVRWTPTPMLRPDRHNEIEINFLGGETPEARRYEPSLEFAREKEAFGAVRRARWFGR